MRRNRISLVDFVQILVDSGQKVGVYFSKFNYYFTLKVPVTDIVLWENVVIFRFLYLELPYLSSLCFSMSDQPQLDKIYQKRINMFFVIHSLNEALNSKGL